MKFLLLLFHKTLLSIAIDKGSKDVVGLLLQHPNIDVDMIFI